MRNQFFSRFINMILAGDSTFVQSPESGVGCASHSFLKSEYGPPPSCFPGVSKGNVGLNFVQKALLHKSKTTQSGFSFLELMIVLALIGLLGAFAVPNLFRTKQGAQRKEFLASFETLVKDAMLLSIVENKMHQVYLDIVHELVQIREYDAKSIETNQHKKFKKVSNAEYATQIPFLKRFTIQNFFINGVDEVTPGNQMQDVMFYIMPDGTSQAIMINLIDHDDDGQAPDVQFSCVINPFYARMTSYDAFQTP